MSQSKRDAIQQYYNAPVTAITAALKKHAEVAAMRVGHSLTTWYSAKRRYGKGSEGATCVTCGCTAYIFPYGQGDAVSKIARQVAGFGGSALQVKCVDQHTGRRRIM